jgi:proline utilization trans-activator
MKVEVFLPFDLDFLCAASVQLLMASAIFPHMTENQPGNQRDAHLIFDEMIRKGNRVAETRKAELNFLELLFQEFVMRIREQESQPLSRSSTVDPTQTSAEIMASEEQQQQAQEGDNQPTVSQQGTSGYVSILPAMVNPTGMPLPVARGYLQPSEIAGFLDNIGISSDAFLSIVDQMGSQDYNTFGYFD